METSGQYCAVWVASGMSSCAGQAETPGSRTGHSQGNELVKQQVYREAARVESKVNEAEDPSASYYHR